MIGSRNPSSAVLFQSSRLISGQRFVPSNLFQKAASGLGEEEHLAVVEYAPTLQPSAWSPDGKVIALAALAPETGADIVFYSFETDDIEVYLKTEYDELAATFSPDGHWLAYESDESGEFEVFVTSYPGPGGKWQVSRGGGAHPVWRADGRELFYIDEDAMMAVSVEAEGTFRHATPVTLFKRPEILMRSGEQTYDVALDGQRFLLLVPQGDDPAGTASVTLLQGWRALLE